MLTDSTEAAQVPKVMHLEQPPWRRWRLSLTPMSNQMPIRS